MKWQYHDPSGGRANPSLHDCVARSSSIALREDYNIVSQDLLVLSNVEELKGRQKRSHPDTGISQRVIESYFRLKNWKRVAGPFKWSELPTKGTIIVELKWHLAAVVNGVLHDTYDSSKNGRAKIYAYYKRG